MRCEVCGVRTDALHQGWCYPCVREYKCECGQVLATEEEHTQRMCRPCQVFPVTATDLLRHS